MSAPGPGAAQAETGLLLTVRDVAHLLRVSSTHVARLVDREGLPAIRLCGGARRRTLRFRRQEVEEWLAGRDERRMRDLIDGGRYTRRRLVRLVEGGDQAGPP